MAAKIGYRDRRQKRGIATNLEWFHNGRKWRPLLGYDLTDDEKDLRATEAVQKILAAIKRGEIEVGGSTNSRVHTLEQAAEKWYYPSLTRQKRVDLVRPKQCVSHLSKRLPGPIDTFTLESVHGYIDNRQEEGAAGGTIRREVGVLSRILSLAKRNGAIRSNPCDDGVELPEDVERKRVVTAEEIRIMQQEAKHDLWRAIIAELTTGLRRERLLGIETQWISRDKSGQRWLNPPKSNNKLKLTPETIALGSLATWALLEAGVVPLRGKIFRRWKQPRAFSQAWERLIARCKRKHPALFDDLHFHDLRHTFNSVLGGLGVPYQVIQFLMGHKVKGATWRYFHMTPELRDQLVDAAGKLDAWLNNVLAENRAGASANTAVND